MEGEIASLPSTTRRRSLSLSSTPKSCCSFEFADSDGDFSPEPLAISGPIPDGDWFEIQKHRTLRDLQLLVNRYNDCFLSLQAAASESARLRDENLHLAAENLKLSFLLAEKEKKQSVPARRSADREKENVDPTAETSPRGVGGGGRHPKSISIRSSGYLSVKQPPNAVTAAMPPHRLRLPISPVQRGGEREGEGEGEGDGEGEVEVDVYSQGTEKTELCNKWGEKGWCPYEDRCRFAHGIEEMRPVIRHPRYKTQLCRFLGKGGDCPYGHRCHFRHALPGPADR